MFNLFNIYKQSLYFIFAALGFFFLLILSTLNANDIESIGLNLVVSFAFLGLYIFSLSREYVWLKFYFISIFIFLGLHPIFLHIGFIDSYTGLISAASIKTHVSILGNLIAYKSLYYFILGTFLGTLLVKSLKQHDFLKIKTSTRIFSANLSLKISLLIFFIFFAMILIDKVYIFINAKNVGYVEAFHIGTSRNFIFIFVDSLFPLSFAFLLKSIIFNGQAINSKKYIIFSIIFLLPYFFTFLSGFRGEFIAKLMVIILIFLLKVNSISIMYFLFLGFISLFGIVSMEFIRFDTDLSPFDIPLELYVEGFLYAGNSFSVIGYVADYSSYLHHQFMYIFGPIIGLFSNAETYTLDGVSSKPYLAQHLMYHMDHEKFFRGSTIGSSSVAELYMINQSFHWIFMGAASFVLIANFFAKNFLNSSIMIFVAFTFFENFIISPRGGFLKFIDKEFILAISLYVFILMILKIFSKRFRLN